MYFRTDNFGIGAIASLWHPMPFSSYANGADGDGGVPTFIDPPYPFNCLSKGFASTFECYQCTTWLFLRPNAGQMTYKLKRVSYLSFVEALDVLHAVWSTRSTATKCLDPQIHPNFETLGHTHAF